MAEWVLLQALIHGDGHEDRCSRSLLPVAVAVVALTAGLALLTFVKAYGIAFLARAAVARAPAALTRARPGDARGDAARRAVAVLAARPGPGPGRGGAGRRRRCRRASSAVGLLGARPAGVGALLDPVALAAAGAAVAVPVLVVTGGRRGAAPRRDVDLAWGCGGVRVSPRMQYTATSYAEPLVRVFDDALQPERDLEVTHLDESRYLVAQVRFRQRVADVVASGCTGRSLRRARPVAGAGRPPPPERQHPPLPRASRSPPWCVVLRAW